MKITIQLLLPLMLLMATVPAHAVTVYLVRHAEKQAGNDPSLTEAGRERARNLALLLKDADIRHIFSTSYRRTMETAQPLAEALQLEVQSYDPADLTGFARRLRRLNGAALVVGHSNTTPELVQFLGGEAENMEDWEYTRVYRIQLEAGSTHTLLLHLPPGFAPEAGQSTEKRAVAADPGR
ncbi:MAG: phosphoglycerate mutase family protein [Xanthomonadales bacterium]|nr:phosphoglycerate mutase family protein [Xanthomonadales bacterium]